VQQSPFNPDTVGLSPRSTGFEVIQGGRLVYRSAGNALTNREKERNLQKIKGLARLWQTIPRRVIRTGNQSSAWYADQANHCSIHIPKETNPCLRSVGFWAS